MAILNNLVVNGNARILNKLYVSDLDIPGEVAASAFKAGAAGFYINNKQAIYSNGNDNYLYINGNKAFSEGVNFGSSFVNMQKSRIQNELIVGPTSNDTPYLSVTSSKTDILSLHSDNASFDYITGRLGVFDNFTVQDVLRAYKYNLTEITALGGQFYVSPVLYFKANPTFTIDTFSEANNILTVAAHIIDTSTITTDTIGGVQWTQNSKIKISGIFKKDSEEYSLKSVPGELSNRLNSNSGRLDFTFQINKSQFNEEEKDKIETFFKVTNYTYSSANIRDLAVMIYEKGNPSAIGTEDRTFPVGILLTGYGTNNASYIDMYNGETTRTKPALRLGYLNGLSNEIEISGKSPTGWGLYSQNVFLTGTIFATGGSIGGFTMDTNTIHTTGLAVTQSDDGSIALSSNTNGFTRTIGGTSRSNLRFAIGSKFAVNNIGALYAYSGYIGCWNITQNALYSDDHQAYNTNANGIYMDNTYIAGGKQAQWYLKSDGSAKIGKMTLSADGTLTIPATQITGLLKHGTNNMMIGTWNPMVSSDRLNMYGMYIRGDTDAYLHANGRLSEALHGVKNEVTTVVRPQIMIGLSSSILPLEIGETYTLSFDWEAKVYGAKVANLSTDMYLRVYFWYYDGSTSKNINQTLVTFEEGTTTNMGEVLTGRCEFTFKVPEANYTKSYFYFMPNLQTAEYHAIGDYVQMTNIMLEHADYASDYAPAPEDLSIDNIYSSYEYRNLLINTKNPVYTSDGKSMPKFYKQSAFHVYTDCTYSTAYHGFRSTMAGGSYPRFRIGQNEVGLGGLTAGKTYTISFDYEAKLFSNDTTDATSRSFWFQIYDNISGSNAIDSTNFSNIVVFSIEQSEKGKVITGHRNYTFTIPEDVTIFYLYGRPSNTGHLDGDYVELTNMIVVEGSTPMQYISAPEDNMTDIGVFSPGTTTIDGGKITTGSVTANQIATDAIRSKTYTYTSGNFSTTGTMFNLAGTGYIRSKNFAIDTSGNAYFKGNIEANSGTIGAYTIDENSLYSDEHSTWNSDVNGIYIGKIDPNDNTSSDNYIISGGNHTSSTDQEPKWYLKSDGSAKFGKMILSAEGVLSIPAAEITGLSDYGRNLIVNTAYPSTTLGKRPHFLGQETDPSLGANTITVATHGIRSTKTTNNYPYIYLGETESMNGLEYGETYTISFNYECKLFSGLDNETYGTTMYFRMYYADDNGTSHFLTTMATYPKGDFGTVKSGYSECTFTIPPINTTNPSETITKYQLRIRPANTTASFSLSGDYVEISNIMLVRGDHACKYAPAPEDVEVGNVYSEGTTTINGGLITTNSIAAAKLVVGDFTNLASITEINPQSLIDIREKSPFSTVPVIADGYLQKASATTQYLPLSTYRINGLKGGDQISYVLTARAEVAGTIPLRLWFYDGDTRTYHGLLNVAQLALTTTDKVFSGSYTLPESVTVNNISYTISNQRYFAIGIDDNRSTKSQVYAKQIIIRRKTGEIATDAIKSLNYSYSSGAYSNAGTFFNLADGGIISKNFAIDSSGSAYFNGQVNATTGKIGGWEIESNLLRKKVYNSSNQEIALFQLVAPTSLESDIMVLRMLKTPGDTSAPSPYYPFYVRANGYLHCQYGQIGGWDITDSAMYRTNSTWGSATANSAYFGVNGLSITDKFKVSAAGALTATSGIIGGWNINSGSISKYNYNSSNKETNYIILQPGNATDGDVFVIRKYSIPGDITSAYYPFALKSNGHLHSSFGDIGGWTISSNSISSYSLPETEFDQEGNEIILIDDQPTSQEIIDFDPDDTWTHQESAKTFRLSTVNYQALLLGTQYNNIRLNIGQNFGIDDYGKLYASAIRMDKIQTIRDTYFSNDDWHNTTTYYDQIYTLYAGGVNTNKDIMVVRLKKAGTTNYTYPFYLRANGDIGLSRVVTETVFTHAPVLLNLSAVDNASHIVFKPSDGATLAYTAASSQRYKDILRPLTSQDINQLYNIQPVLAKYKEGYLDISSERYGKYVPMFIAEDVDKYFSDGVDHNKEGLAENWNYRYMIPAMFQMIKDLKQQIDQLKSTKGQN